MFLDETRYNLTCLPTGEWSEDLLSCIEIYCEPVKFEKTSVLQIVRQNPSADLGSYRTKFFLSCASEDEVFEFGEELTDVEYYCNRR